MEIIGYIAAILIGVSLGMIGGGGSILTVPVLVYLFNTDPVLATTWSLFIVGVTSLTGGIRAYTKGKVDFKSVSEFGFPSILSIFITRHFLLPAIPDTVFTVGDFVMTKGSFLIIIFPFTAIAIIGIFAGSRFSEKLTGDKLKKGFGWFVLIMSVFIIIKEVFLK